MTLQIPELFVISIIHLDVQISSRSVAQSKIDCILSNIQLVHTCEDVNGLNVG
jgi:hypothetical protein